MCVNGERGGGGERSADGGERCVRVEMMSC